MGGRSELYQLSDEDPDEVTADNELEHSAEEEAEEGADAGLEGLGVVLPVLGGSEEGAYEGADDDAPREEEHAHDGADEGASVGPFASTTGVLGAQHGDDVVKHLHDDDQQQAHQQFGDAELYAVGQVQQDEAYVCYGWSGQHGQDAAYQADDEAEDAEGDEEYVHDNIRRPTPTLPVRVGDGMSACLSVCFLFFTICSPPLGVVRGRVRSLFYSLLSPSLTGRGWGVPLLLCYAEPVYVHPAAVVGNHVGSGAEGSHLGTNPLTFAEAEGGA